MSKLAIMDQKAKKLADKLNIFTLDALSVKLISNIVIKTNLGHLFA
jgi:hypothetical protein